MIVGNTASGGGGGMYLGSATATVTNNTIVANSTFTNGGGVYMTGAPSQSLYNCIVAFNSSGIYVAAGGPVVRRNCLYGNAMYDYQGPGMPTKTVQNISMDPMLGNLAYGNGHIQPGSPCIDAGTNAFSGGDIDIDGQPRIQPAAGIVDIGADESDGTTIWSADPPTVVRVSPQGDDEFDGSTWSHAKQTVSAGIASATISCGEVWVAGGTYHERVALVPCTYVYGGFVGSETQHTQRDWNANPTVLDADESGTVVTARTGHTVGGLDGFTLTGGRGESGGGIYLRYASPTIAHNTIVANNATASGGGIHALGSFSPIENNIIRGNSADEGGGVFNEFSRGTLANNVINGNVALTRGGGLYMFTSHSSMLNITIAGNSAPEGGGLYAFNGLPSSVYSNSIVAFNSSGIRYSTANGPGLRFNCVFGNAGYNYSGMADPTGTYGNLATDPAFVRNPAPGVDDGDLRLTAASPCIDAGNNAVVPVALVFDVAGLSRIVDDPFVADSGAGTPPIIDMGAYEFQLPGDCNLNWQIDLTDYAEFADCLAGPVARRTIDCACADFDADGDVDLADFANLSWAFGG
jgi:hypothetical protein